LIGVFWLTVLSQIGILSFVDTFGSFFGPIFGVMIADYYLINNKNLINKDLYSSETDSIYYFSNGWHLKGVYSIFIGFVFSVSTIWNVNLMFLHSFAWIIGAFISSIIYYLLAKK
jgi:NCS1 family nucleobase:cation symporter-1